MNEIAYSIAATPVDRYTTKLSKDFNLCQDLAEYI